jgi:signal transduction histidine kinase
MRRFYFWAVALAVLVILLFNVQGWIVLRRTSMVLEDELGARLESIALTLARSIADRPLDSVGPALLTAAEQDNGLFSLFIVDDSLRYVVNTREPALVGLSDPALELDAPEILTALVGIPARSRLYAAGPYYLKTAYAPLEDSLGETRAVLGVEADARFFATLVGFRRSLLLVNGLSLVAILAVVLVSVSLAQHALRLEQAAGRAGTMALLGQMSAALAHDIKNPLGIIRAAAERLKKRYGSGTDDRTFDYITEEVDRLSGLVTGYLGLGRMTPGTPEPLDLAALIQDVLRTMEHETARHGIAVETNLGQLPEVIGSRLELRQVFLNLVLNAIQAQPEGGLIRVEGRVERRNVVIRVNDKGPGIRPEHQSRVFEPFFTTKEKGSGLGLFSVKRIVEAHRGRVRVDSCPGSGTTVEIQLPR